MYSERNNVSATDVLETKMNKLTHKYRDGVEQVRICRHHTHRVLLVLFALFLFFLGTLGDKVSASLERAHLKVGDTTHVGFFFL